MTTEILNEFEIILLPLDTTITLVYENVLRHGLTTLHDKYKEDILNTKSAKESVADIVNDASKYALSLLSKKYRKRLLQFYNHEGLAYYTYVNVNRLAMSHIDDLMSN